MISSVPDAQHEDRSASAHRVEPSRRARDLFEQAGEQLESGRPDAALSLLRQAAALDPEHPRIQSRMALAMLRSGERFDEARGICEEAVKRAFDDVGPYLDLAQLYFEVGRRGEALRCLRRGRMIDAQSETIVRLLDQLGERRAPVIPVLPRRHPLNRLLGAARARLLGLIAGNRASTPDRGLDHGAR